ncbi:unnamed protein product, partial [Brachionus calyciflorus]
MLTYKKFLSNDFGNPNFSYIKINMSHRNLVLIWVWIPFNDKSQERLLNFKSTISAFEELIETNSSDSIIFTGDCKKYIRNKKYELLFKNFIDENNLVSCVNLTISFGYLPDNFYISLVTPIPKKGNLNSPSDYRPISVSSTFSVKFESILLSNMEFFNDISSNEFGYRKNSSCKQANFLVNESINHYRQGGSKLHFLSLDATKAFYKLSPDGLFFKLIGMIPKEIWRIFYSHRAILSRHQYVQSTKLREIFTKGFILSIVKYHPDDVYNADEAGLFFRLGQSQNIFSRNESCKGTKKEKARITILLASNISGKKKLKPFKIHTSTVLRCLKYTNFYTLPVRYASNKSAWMTGELWLSWLKWFDSQLTKESLLLIDNCHAHVDSSHLKLKFLKIHCLLPKTTSLIQPMDAGIIKTFKSYYRKILVSHWLDNFDKKKNFELIIIKQAISNFIDDAWSLIDEGKIRCCWRHT